MYHHVLHRILRWFWRHSARVRRSDAVLRYLQMSDSYGMRRPHAWRYVVGLIDADEWHRRQHWFPPHALRRQVDDGRNQRHTVGLDPASHDADRPKFSQ